MELTYNGLTLEIGRVNAFEQRAVYTDDGSDYLYTHFYINVQCVFNPYATHSSVGAVNDRGQLFYVGRDDPQTTINQLSHILQEPRRLLTIKNGGFLILQSPSTLLLSGGTQGVVSVNPGVDAKTGPHPISLNVMSIHGAKTIILNYEIETWVNECTLFSGALIANRWEMSEDLDERFLSTRTTRGTAYFRQDVLAATNTTPDDYRNAIIVPTPDTDFRRTSVHISIDENRCAVRYEVVDEEQVMNILPDTGIVKIEGYQSYELDWEALIPMADFELVFSIWGEKLVTRKYLVDKAVETIMSLGAKFFKVPQIFSDNGVNILPFTRSGIRVYLEERRADCWFKSRVSSAFITGLNIVDSFKDAFTWARGFGDEAAVAWQETVADYGVSTPLDGRKNVSPPASMGTRGMYLARIFSQVLGNACPTIVAPPYLPPTTTDLNSIYGPTEDVVLKGGQP